MHARDDAQAEYPDGIVIHPTYLAKLEKMLPLFDALTDDDQDVILLVLYTWVTTGEYYDVLPRPPRIEGTGPLTEVARVLGRVVGMGE